ncbi:MAG: flagellar basal body rod protein FlgC [Rhodospirillales bacterium]|jgi:flagellar basal-body rod protein FlgC|nr:flagellar basal body rod protein FlgC [Rhodospirillales bacterium]
MDLTKALSISASGMNAQGVRLRVIAENLANQDTTGSSPGANPYRRKTVTFADSVNRQTGTNLVTVAAIGQDPSAFPLRYDPSNPAANTQGYVKLPNVNSFIEMMDMRDAERSYDANLSVLQATRSMLTRTIDLLK